MACSSVESFHHVGEWYYRAEGGASLVIFNPKTRTVLKIRKSRNSKHSPQKVIDNDLQSCRGFIRTAIEPLLDMELIGLSTMVPVTKEFLESLAHRFKDQRPEKRLNTQVDITRLHVLNLPDFCFLQHRTNVLSDSPTFCVEIKPKRGFLPVSRHVPDDLAIKYSVCRYCLLQQHKVQQGVWEKRSHFCPLDLFSCDPPRMKYCLNMLLQNPQNNLRIFKDGIAIYQAKEKSTPSLAEQQELVKNLGQYFGASCAEESKEDPLESSCVQSLLDVVVQALISNNTRNGIKPLMNGFVLPMDSSQQTCTESGYASCRKGKYPTEVNVEVSDKCILRRLLSAQSLSLLEIDVILPLYQKVLLYLQEHPQDCEKYRLDFPYEDGFSVLDDGTACRLNALEDARNGEKLDVSGVSIKDAVELIRKYLITRTFKDCSIMLAMQLVTKDESLPLPCGVPLVRTTQGRSYMYSATVVDLDPKPSARIPMYESLDRDVAREYVARHQNGFLE